MLFLNPIHVFLVDLPLSPWTLLKMLTAASNIWTILKWKAGPSQLKSHAEAVQGHQLLEAILVIGTSVEIEGDIAEGGMVDVMSIMAMGTTAGRPLLCTLPTGMVGTTILTETPEITLLPPGTTMKAGVGGNTLLPLMAAAGQEGRDRFHRIGWQKEAMAAAELVAVATETRCMSCW